MTDKEKAIVMAYTGIAMLTGNKFQIFHKYVEEIMCRPVFTHEFATCAEEIKEKAKFDFLALCVEEDRERPHGEWIKTGRTNIYGGFEIECSVCHTKLMVSPSRWEIGENFCDVCGASMQANDRQVTGKLKEGEAE